MAAGDEDRGPQSGRPSKSRLKRACHELEDLGQQLVELPTAQLAAVPMPELLAEAVQVARSISSFGALKRQRKFIAKLLREMDVEPIRQRLAALDRDSAESIHRHHRLERWRDQMLAAGEGVIDEFLRDYPRADRQKLRQLARDARKESAAGAPPRSARLLFRYLREVAEASESPPADVAD